MAFIIWVLVLPIFLYFVFQFFTGERNIISLMPMIIGLMVVVMVGNMVFDEMGTALRESDVNIPLSNVLFGGSSSQEKTANVKASVPSNDVEKRCDGRTDTISIKECKENGRICKSISVDCDKINEEGYTETTGWTKIKMPNFIWIFVVGAFIISIIFYKNFGRRWSL